MSDAPDPRIIRLEKENQRLKRAVDELSVINEVAVAISSTLTLDKIVDLIVQKIVKYLKVEQAAVQLLNEEEGSELKTMIRRADDSETYLPFRLDQQLTGWMLKNKQPLRVDDLATDDRFHKGNEEIGAVHSVLSVPLMLKGKMIGLITGFNKRGNEAFTDEEMRLLSIIAAQSAQVIEHARLYEEEQRLQRMQEQMKLASDIQMRLMPKSVPELSGYDIAGVSFPAQEVGGDYFDYVSITEDRLAVCLGDVCGKGLPAALLMANLQATIRSQAITDPPPQLCMERSNKLLFESTDRQKFATMCYGVIDANAHQFSYANAGHNRPILLRGGKDLSYLELAGLGLSLMSQSKYKEETVALEKGDLVVLYSDGITEAMSEENEEYSDPRLEKLVQKLHNESAQKMVDEIVNDVRVHAGKAPQSDDITILVVKRIG